MMQPTRAQTSKIAFCAALMCAIQKSSSVVAALVSGASPAMNQAGRPNNLDHGFQIRQFIRVEITMTDIAGNERRGKVDSLARRLVRKCSSEFGVPGETALRFRSMRRSMSCTDDGFDDADSNAPASLPAFAGPRPAS